MALNGAEWRWMGTRPRDGPVPRLLRKAVTRCTPLFERPGEPQCAWPRRAAPIQDRIRGMRPLTLTPRRTPEVDPGRRRPGRDPYRRLRQASSRAARLTPAARVAAVPTSSRWTRRAAPEPERRGSTFRWSAWQTHRNGNTNPRSQAAARPCGTAHVSYGTQHLDGSRRRPAGSTIKRRGGSSDHQGVPAPLARGRRRDRSLPDRGHRDLRQ